MSKRLDRSQIQKTAPRPIPAERVADSHGESKGWSGPRSHPWVVREPRDDNRDYHRTLAHGLINDMSLDDAWDMAIEFGWVGVISQLGDLARHQIAHEMTQV